MSRTARVVSLLLAVGCGAPSPAKSATPFAPEEPYIAMLDDLAGYAKWTRYDRGVDRVPPTHDGPTWIHIDPPPRPGQREFAVGTRIVRVEAREEAPTTWELHAMVKRGGDFNAEGARGWEFFELSLDPGRNPRMVWRGLGPPSGDGYRAVEGGHLLDCNHCHAAAEWNDSVLSPPLTLAATP